MLNGETFAIKNSANKKFMQILYKALNEKNSFEYSFDSLINISHLVSPDNKFRMFTWSIFNDAGIYKNFGCIQIYNDKTLINKIIFLNDKSDSIEKPENLILSDRNWFGAVYYKVICSKYKNNRYYTLIGWQGNNLLLRKKVIDVLTLDSYNNPSFGASIFKNERTQPKRVIFEYSGQAVMALRYEQQYYSKIKGQSIYAYDKIDNIERNKTHKYRNNKVRKKKAFMIIFDRLVPLSPGLENQFQYYVPSSDFVDGFIFKEGKWRLIFDIDARNSKKPEKQNNEVKTIHYNLFQNK
jgi:hypothetical protein